MEFEKHGKIHHALQQVHQLGIPLLPRGKARKKEIIQTVDLSQTLAFPTNNHFLQYLFFFFIQRDHTISIDVRTTARSQPVFAQIQGSAAIHDGISVHPDVLEIMSICTELSSEPRYRVRPDNVSLRLVCGVTPSQSFSSFCRPDLESICLICYDEQ